MSDLIKLRQSASAIAAISTSIKLLTGVPLPVNSLVEIVADILEQSLSRLIEKGLTAPGLPVLLAADTSRPRNRVFLVDVPSKCQSFFLLCEPVAGYDQRIFVPTTPSHEGEQWYGHWGIAYTSPSSEKAYVHFLAQHIQTKASYLKIPSSALEASIRLSLAPFVSWKLYDTGERL